MQSISLSGFYLFCLCIDVVQILDSQAKLLRIVNLPLNIAPEEVAFSKIISAENSDDYLIQRQSWSTPLLAFDSFGTETSIYNGDDEDAFYVPEWSTFSHIYCNVDVHMRNGNSLLHKTLCFDPNVKSFVVIDQNVILVLDWFGFVRIHKIHKNEMKIPISETSLNSPNYHIIKPKATQFKNVTSMGVKKTITSHLELYLLQNDKISIHSIRSLLVK